MKLYKIAQASSIMYYGHDDPNDHSPQEHGAFLTPDPNVARRGGEHVDAFQIKPGKYYYPDISGSINPKDLNVVRQFAKEFLGNKKVDFRSILSELLFHPTKEWLTFLREKGYLGFINGNYIFITDAKNTRYLGEYDIDSGNIRSPEMKIANSLSNQSKD